MGHPCTLNIYCIKVKEVPYGLSQICYKSDPPLIVDSPVRSHDPLVSGREDDAASDEVDEIDVDEYLSEGVRPLAEGERQVGVDVLEEDVAVGHHTALRVHPLLRRLTHDVEKLKN